jgi:Bromodomain
MLRASFSISRHRAEIVSNVTKLNYLVVVIMILCDFGFPTTTAFFELWRLQSLETAISISDSAMSGLVSDSANPLAFVEKASKADVDARYDVLTHDETIESNLFRLTAGLPKRELRSVVQEATECEALLLSEIQILEDALNNDPISTVSLEASDDSLKQLLESPLSPLDRFLTVSALLGRLRQDLALPSQLSVNNMTSFVNSAVNEEKAMEELTGVSSSIAETYLKIQSSETLLSVWRKISTNRAAFVFKRPVKSEEAPGYADRIHFPMDLSLIRKRIITNNIRTFSDLHMALGLITHNCVKYNGRETDYGRVAREFEALVDSVILQAVNHATTNPYSEPSSETDEAVVKALKDEEESGEPLKTSVSPNVRTDSDGITETFPAQEIVVANETIDSTNSLDTDSNIVLS